MKKYQGVIVPMVSPINEVGKIDEASVEKLIDTFITTHTYPFVIGTTGEASSLPIDLKKDLINLMVRYGKDTTTYAGISSNCFSETVELAHYCADKGVDVLVAHLPCYYAISDKHMLRYYEDLVAQIELPLFLYNIPVTTNISIPLEVAEKLSHHPKIVGLKDSERGEERLAKNLELWKDRTDFSFLLGWASKTAEAVEKGADGTVPSTGNLIPGYYQQIVHHAASGNSTEANKFQAICDAVSACYQKGRLLVDMIPALKYLLSLADICTPYVLPPMISLSQPEKEKIGVVFEGVLQACGIERALLNE